MIEFLIIGAGGAIGAILRYLLSFIQVGDKTTFPYATLITNVIGAFIIGIVVGFALKNNSDNDKLILFLKVGVCGGFTTFSSFALESVNLFEGNKTLIALIYITLSIVLSLLAVIAGKAIVTF